MIREMIVTNPAGLHLLVVQELHEVAKKYGVHIFIKHKNVTASAENIMKMLALGIKNKDKILVIVDGEEEQQVMDLISGLLGTEEE